MTKENNQPSESQSESIESVGLIKRTHVYLQSPKHFEISNCDCGNSETQWSEYKAHIWCDTCQKDFIPESNGVFDGPIMIGLSSILGISYDRLNSETHCVEIIDSHTNYIPCLKSDETIKTGLIPLFIKTRETGAIVAHAQLDLIQKEVIDFLWDTSETDAISSFILSHNLGILNPVGLEAEVFFDYQDLKKFNISFNYNKDNSSISLVPNKPFEDFVFNKYLSLTLPPAPKGQTPQRKL